jgi:division protein CdvB (Snf7/Vps24/ESCRT-III family)
MTVDKFIKNWERDSEKSLTNQIGEHLNRTPLKERVMRALYKLKTMQSKLEQTVSRIESKDKELFSKCVNAQMAKDFDRAKIYANECSQLRNMVKTLLSSQMALERVALRLETVEEFGDIANTMGPVVGVVKALKGKLAGVVPEISYELGTIGETLNDLVMEAGHATGSNYSFETYGTESQNILSEASTVAEQRMKEEFPELPSSPGSASEKTI